MEPQVRIGVVACVHGAGHAQWLVTWSVSNDAPSSLRLEDAWIPHGRFRGDGHLALSELIPAGGETLLEFSVMSSGEPGEVVENAFLILQVRSDDQAWRVFARMRIEFDAHAGANPVLEAVSTQSIHSVS